MWTSSVAPVPNTCTPSSVRSCGETLDWTRFVELTTAYRVKNPVYFALALARDVDDAPVPEATLQALQPPLYRRACFQGYLVVQRRIVDKLPYAKGMPLRWTLASILSAATLVDSIRTVVATMAFGLRRPRLMTLRSPT